MHNTSASAGPSSSNRHVIHPLIRSSSARKSDFERQQSSSFGSQAGPHLSNASSVSFYQNRSSGGNDVRRRRTTLPTPRKPPPPKPIPTKSRPRLGNHWQLDHNEALGEDDDGEGPRPRRRPEAAVIGFQGARTTFGGRKVRKITEPVPRGPWEDRHGNLRNPDSDESDMEVDDRSLGESDSDMVIDMPKRTARKTGKGKATARTISAAATHRLSGSADATETEREAVEAQLPVNDDDDDEEEEELPFSAPRIRRRIHVSDEEEDEPEESSSSDSDVEYVGDSINRNVVSAPSSALKEAILPFVPTISNLPFLRRNLRVSFLKYFAQRGIGGVEYDHQQKVTVQVLLRGGSDNSSLAMSLDSWSCPLCEILGPLPTRQILDKHLLRQHEGVQVMWLKVDDDDDSDDDDDEDVDVQKWRLIITFPDPSTRSEERVARRFRFATLKASVDEQAQANISLLTSLSLGNEDSEEDIKLNVTPASSNRTSSVSLKKLGPGSSLDSPGIESPPRGRSPTVETRSPTPTPRKRDPRYPTPPPPDNLLGPAARYPYLPATSEDRTITIKYSCRPGGPYLYDLLGLLPLDEFGVLSWQVLDREAEILESDDIRDEHKVMHALWARWIMVNRLDFVRDYVLGTLKFIEKYWKMIHKAAGWSALRYWLLMLMANRFLKASEVAQILQAYEKKTGMNDWYPDS